MFLISGEISGQVSSGITREQCSSVVNSAGLSYEKGLYEECIKYLEEALKKCELSRQEKEYAMELLAKSYVEIKDPVKAESVVGEMLKKYPHYELNESANFESYNRLVNKYKIHPAFSIGIKNVIMWVGYNTSGVFTIPPGPVNTAPYRSGDYFFTYYGWAELEFGRGISLNADLMWWTSYYRKDFPKDNFDIHFEERPEFIEIPVFLKKYFPVRKNILPYAAAGAGWLYMTKAIANVSKYDRFGAVTYYENGVNTLPMRTRHNFEWLAGAGIGYKFRNVRMFLDIRYFGGLTSLTDPDHRMDNQVLANDYYYVDNSVKMTKFEFGASISYTLINSVKRIDTGRR